MNSIFCKAAKLIAGLSGTALVILLTPGIAKTTTLGLQAFNYGSSNNGLPYVNITDFFGTPNPNLKQQTLALTAITPTGNPASSSLIPSGTTYNPLSAVYTTSQNPNNDFQCLQATTVGCTPIPALGNAPPQSYQQKFIVKNNTSLNISAITLGAAPPSTNSNDPTYALEQSIGYQNNPNYSVLGANSGPNGSTSDIFSNITASLVNGEPTIALTGGIVAPGQYFLFQRSFNNQDPTFPYEKIYRTAIFTAVPEPSSTLGIFTWSALGGVSLLLRSRSKIATR